MDNHYSPYKDSLEAASRRRRQFWWQILLPVLVAAVIMIALAYFSTRASNAQISIWGNVSTMLVVLPVLLSCLVALAISVALILGIGRLLKILPAFFIRAREFLYKVNRGIQRFSDKAAAPIIKARSTTGGVRDAFRGENTASK